MSDIIKAVLEEENKLQAEVEAARQESLRRIEAERGRLAQERDQKKQRIILRHKERAAFETAAVKERADEELRQLRLSQDALCGDAQLRRRIQDAVIAIILEV